MRSVIIKMVLFIFISAAFLSFSVGLGGEGFEISVGNKVIFQKYGNQVNDVSKLQLDERSINEQLIIKYHHCGRIGKNRVVTIKDIYNKVVKEWHFADDSMPVGAMNCSVREILDLNTINGPFKLYYSSTELPNGRLLTGIIITKGKVARL
ncbi:MAG: hypothetical protein ABIO04_00520 [Ferruginibacter sp.]